MTKSRLMSSFFAAAFLLGAFTQVHSETVSLDYVFVDAALSGSFSYDDNTSVPLSGHLSGFTAYTPIALSVTYSSVGAAYSWSLADYIPFILTTYTLLPTIDPYGIWQTSEVSIAPVGWANSTFVNAQGAKLFFNTCISTSTTPNSWCGNSVLIQDPYSNGLANSQYGTSPSAVPIPNVLWLLGTGLLYLINTARKSAVQLRQYQLAAPVAISVSART